MAFYKLKQLPVGQKSLYGTMDNKLAQRLWRVMIGELKGTPAELAKCDKIDKLWLNMRSAPESYKAWIAAQQPAVQVRMPYKDGV